MIYQTIALYYVRIVNPDVYEHASQFEVPPAHWSYGILRANETNAGNWTVVKDGKLTIPLENWLEAMERRTVKIGR
jgi:hypothetical protein